MRIGIITCKSVTDDCNCAAEGCFRTFNMKSAAFERYGDEKIELVAFNTCAGCPTLFSYDKILKRVKPLVEFSKPDKIHLSSCMVTMCPFVKKYKQIIEEAYPNVEVVMGTDAKDGNFGETVPEVFHKLLSNTDNDITDEFKKLKE